MRTGRSVGIAPLTWAIPAFLMCGSGLAWADELADLRANQELLQRRVDQLAQVPPPPPGGGPGEPGMAGSFPRSFGVSGTGEALPVASQWRRSSVPYMC